MRDLEISAKFRKDFSLNRSENTEDQHQCGAASMMQRALDGKKSTVTLALTQIVLGLSLQSRPTGLWRGLPAG